MEKLRERGKRSDIPEEDWDKYLEQTAASPEDKMVLEQCMKALDDSERQVVILHAVGGMKHRETAELMGLPLATVLSKYSRAIKKLKSNVRQLIITLILITHIHFFHNKSRLRINNFEFLFLCTDDFYKNIIGSVGIFTLCYQAAP